MNYIVYGKKIGRQRQMCIRDSPDCGRAKMYADKLAEMVPGFIFQVRGAGTRKVYYEKAGKPEESV